ncbi:MAG: hypothetical protein A2177_08565 [Spirochaetes bacterium RBG_13_68_11]|nr:MAG: hypothetical protein A2177_08565 [Spirochaetes bacterium RBG_13_68_11]
MSRIDVSGNTVFTSNALRPLVAGYEGRPLSVAEVCSVAGLLQKHYHTGYPYAQVRVAEPGLRDGVLTLQVLEGRVKDLVIQGNDRYSDAYVRSRLHEMAPGRVLSRRGFEEGVVLLNTTPGLQAQVAVQPAAAADGLFDVTATVKDHLLLASAAADNNILDAFGDWQGRVHVELLDVTGHGDGLVVEPSLRQQKVPNGITLGYRLPLTRDGGTIQATFLDADFQFMKNSPLLGVRTDVSYATVQFIHPLETSFTRSASWSIGASRFASGAKLAGSFETREAVYLLSGSVVFSRGSAGAATTTAWAQFSTNFRRNEGGLRQDAEPARLDVWANHEHWLRPGFSVYLLGIGVLSLDPLPPSQKVTLGGPVCVRGFPIGEVMGDQGYLLRAELRRRFQPHRELVVTPRVTFDQGGVYRKLPDPSAAADPDRKDTLPSAGAGLSAQVFRRLDLSVDWSHPLGDHPVRDGKTSGRFWWTASISY